MHRPGIEPGPPAWQASILPLNQRCFLTSVDKTQFSEIVYKKRKPQQIKSNSTWQEHDFRFSLQKSGQYLVKKRTFLYRYIFQIWWILLKYGLWSFQSGGTKSERFLSRNQFPIHYFKNNFKPCSFISKAFKEILQHFKFVNW